MKVKSESEIAQLFLTLRDPMDCSLPGSSAHGIFQVRVLAWGAIAFSNIYVLYELCAASLHQIYLLQWVLAKKFDSRWAAGT